MKAESNNANGGCVLKLEVAILKKLTGKPHVCKFISAARLTDFTYVIMTLLGKSLNKIVKRVGRQLTVSAQVRIAANILFCLKQIHDIGFIHRDLKPANMALGYKTNSEECRFFHVLDFGLSRQYLVPHSDQPSKFMMRKPRERSLFRGTTRYCSIRMHDRAEQGRVDDLWSMLYLLAELRGPLPWSSQNDKRIVGELKRLHTDEDVLQNCPMEFLEIAKHLRSLTYFHRPDYHKIFMLLLTIVGELKRLHTDEDVLQNCPMEFLEIAKHLRSLTYFHRPDYHKIFMLLLTIVGELKRLHTDEDVLQNCPMEFLDIAKHLRSLTYFHRPDYHKIFMLPSDTPKSVPRSPTQKVGSRERKSREKLSKEDVKTARKMSDETTNDNKVKTSREKTNHQSAEKSSSSDPKAGEQKQEYMKLLPFDLDFFNSDPIGF
ncbi:Protein CBG17985 [Caenorhabditis briggsae]|uniref:Protein CBG17985 n=1 Tax=Caenorhabditis briggsae TaxID=6238 RepID=A8XSR3_CAEBR|nr:Protein CBG17985 [Caenorhabditis briggsae]CAP35515.2 Protein CBG17985 [Caenorhabditis briggsae]